MNKYEKHPSKKLQKLFQLKQYQGQDPKYSKVLILGQDANYPRHMSDKLLDAIEEYHMDGVSYWETHGDEYHHPFLLDIFKSEVGGIRYHRQFRKLKLSSNYAEFISFVELLDEPTTGSTGNENLDGFYSMIKQEHIERLNSWILYSVCL